MILRRNSRPYRILKLLSIGAGFLVLSTLAPQSGAQIVNNLIKEYFYKKRFRKEMFLRDLKRLQIRKLLDYKDLGNGNVKISLTKQGREKILFYNIDDININTQQSWDGKWRLIMFDIPHGQRKARDAFRNKLRELKFHQLQKSVYITPYPCENEIDFIASIFNIRNHILVFTLSNFEGDQKLRHHFNL